MSHRDLELTSRSGNRRAAHSKTAALLRGNLVERAGTPFLSSRLLLRQRCHLDLPNSTHYVRKSTRYVRKNTRCIQQHSLCVRKSTRYVKISTRYVKKEHSVCKRALGTWTPSLPLSVAALSEGATRTMSASLTGQQQRSRGFHLTSAAYERTIEQCQEAGYHAQRQQAGMSAMSIKI